LETSGYGGTLFLLFSIIFKQAKRRVTKIKWNETIGLCLNEGALTPSPSGQG
jgi:hypothetical protein